ncbi:MAG: MerR family transcriptional regulator, partial [Propionibacteriaceae bacterium]
ASALRHYDAVGLLAPECIDIASGYRYYEAHQYDDARLLARLREHGASIEEMRRVLAASGEQRALELDSLAHELMLRAEHAASALRAEAETVRCATKNAPHVAVSCRLLHRALMRAWSIHGESPFDGLIFELDQIVRILVTDRFRLVDIAIPASHIRGKGRVAMSAQEVEMLVKYLGTAPDGMIDIAISNGSLLIEQHPEIVIGSMKMPHLASLSDDFLQSAPANFMLHMRDVAVGDHVTTLRENHEPMMVNTGFLQSAFDLFEATELVVHYRGSRDPIVLTPAGDKTSRMAIMPTRG